MLYDKRWEITADPLSLESLVAWLETMPPRGRYDFNNCRGGCLYGLYMRHHGISWAESGGCSSRDSGQERADFCAKVYDKVACETPWTFGSALKRAQGAGWPLTSCQSTWPFTSRA